MADRGLRVVPPEPLPPARRRRPGPAVVVVVLYGLLFGGGLWLIRPRARTRLFAPSGAAAPAGAGDRPSPPAPDPTATAGARMALVAGSAVPEPRRARYFARLAAEKCDCGCELPERECLARDASCSRSPEIARAIVRTLR